MTGLLLYKTSLEQVLINALREEGIVVSTRTAIEISRVIMAAPVSDHPVFLPLKFQLTPLISRNKEEQEIVHTLFNTLDQKIKEGKVIIPPLPRPAATVPDVPSTPVTRVKEKIKNLSGWKKAIALLLLAAGIVVLVIKLIPPTPSVNLDLGYPPEIYKDEPVSFSASINSNSISGYSVDWKFADTSIQTSWSVTKKFIKEGQQTAYVYLKNEKGNIIDSDTLSFDVKCERTPTLQIADISDSLRETKKISRRMAAYKATFSDVKEGSSFTYQWYNNDKPEGTDSIYTHLFDPNQPGMIRLVVFDNKNLYCSIDSLTAEYSEKENLSAVITGDGALRISKPFDWKRIALSFLFLFIIPLIPAVVLFYTLRKRQLSAKKQPAPIPSTATEEEGPYTIEFPSQDHLIGIEPGMNMLADTLRKRQVSDVYKLNMRKTIDATIRSGGMPQLAYVPLTRPTDFLILIDKDNREALLVRLYEYLVSKLQKEQVYITVYEYEKEPLLLSNQKLNHYNLPVDRLIALYPGTTLFIFGDSRHFISPLKGKLKPWVDAKFGSWETKIFVTPYPKQDWDKKESLLAKAGFFIISADLSAQPAIDLIINKQVDNQNQDKLNIPGEYTARYLNLQDLRSLKDYLQDENLVLWVCSLAVYPEIDWNFAIAVGKELEKRLQQKNKLAELVNYTNLLKLARISWMRDGMISDTLRAEMLDHLDNETEALARQTLLDQLETLKSSVTNNSLIKKTYDVNEKINILLLNAYKGKRLPKSERAAIAGMIDNNQLNIAEEIYLNKAKNTLLKNPYTKRSIKPLAYLKMLTMYEKLVFSGVAAIVFITVFFLSWSIAKKNTHILQWKKNQLYDQEFRIANTDSTHYILNASLQIEDSIYDFTLDNNNGSYHVKADIADTSETGDLRLTTSRGQIISSSPIKLNSKTYTIDLAKAKSVPLYIYYDSSTSPTLLQLVRNSLPGNFRDSVSVTRPPTIGFNIIYSPEYKNEAVLADSLISQATGLLPILIVNDANANSQGLYFRKGISIFIRLNQCTPIKLASIPKSLYEIWKGGSGSNRLINIDLSRQMIYYSTGDKRTYGTYRIEDVCLLNNGTYKFITRADQQFKVFFIRNISAQSFELSVCQNLYNTKEEIKDVDESYCDRFNKMSLYYENDNDKIYLPVNATALEPKQKSKLSSYSQNNVKYFITIYSNPKLSPSLTILKAQQYLRDPGLANSDIKELSQLNNLGVFDRHYVVLSPEQPPVSRPEAPKCNIIFYSIEETKKEKSPGAICQLDLSRQALRSLPKEIESFFNLQALNLGETTIPRAEIDNLQKKLPNCKIRYSNKANAPEGGNKTTELPLGEIKFKGSQPYPDGQSLITSIAGQLNKNPSARIRIEGLYYDDEQQKSLSPNIRTIKDMLAKSGVKSIQVTDILVDRRKPHEAPSKDRRQTNILTNAADGVIQIIGINYY